MLTCTAPRCACVASGCPLSRLWDRLQKSHADSPLLSGLPAGDPLPEWLRATLWRELLRGPAARRDIVIVPFGVSAARGVTMEPNDASIQNVADAEEARLKLRVRVHASRLHARARAATSTAVACAGPALCVLRKCCDARCAVLHGVLSCAVTQPACPAEYVVCVHVCPCALACAQHKR